MRNNIIYIREKKQKAKETHLQQKSLKLVKKYIIKPIICGSR